jgi:hypothetical protein
MQPFWTTHSPTEIALNAALDTIWCIGFVIGWGVALWQHFSQPTVVEPVGSIAEEIKAICHELTIDKAPAKARKRSTKAVSIG